MTAPATGAVFLSYASQDAEAVARIAEALRAAGIEVWFDQSELDGGDAWDQKIRGQVKTCALFVPVISASTDARREGYFRIEWKLAAQRTHAMADGTPFLLPVVIDATSDAVALVPEEFRAVQWTRLKGGETTPAFCARVEKLLAGEMVTGVPWPYVTPGAAVERAPQSRWRTIAAALVLASAVGGLALWKWPRAASPSPREVTPAASAAENRGAPTSASKSIAVLPFANLGDEKDSDYFSDGIAEELLNVLAKAPGLKVSARTSSFHFKGKDTPSPEIARQLGVDYLIEGSVRKAGKTVRITAQLIKAADGFQLWNSGNLERDVTNVFGVQDEIAALVAQNLQLKLGAAAPGMGVGADPEAYELYLQGRRALGRRTYEGFSEADRRFTRASEIAPLWAPVWAGLADLQRLRVFQTGVVPGIRQWPESLRLANSMAEKALSLDPALADAYVAQAGCHWVVWEFPEGERLARRAIALNPNHAAAYLVLGRLCAEQGRMDEALAAFARAAELDPLAPRILDNYANQLEFAGRYAEGWEVIERAAALQPDSTQIQCFRARLLTRLGRRDEALAQARQLAALAGVENTAYPKAEAIGVFMAHGLHDEAERTFATMPPETGERLMALAYLGRTRDALALLGALVNVGWLDDVIWNRAFDPLRGDPLFATFLAKARLTEAHATAQTWRAAHPPGGTKK